MKRVILFSICLLFGCQEEKQEKISPRPVRVFEVGDPKVIGAKAFPGKIRAEDRVNLSFRVDGPLIELPVNVGDRVKTGTLLAKIDPRDYEVKLESIQAKLLSKKAAFEFAKSDFARAEKIQQEDPGAISEVMVDQKRETRNSLEAEVKGLQAEVQKAVDAKNDTSLLAPYPGAIVAKYVENFEHVVAKQPIVRILGGTRVEMVIDVPENLIVYIPDVKEAEVTLDPFPNQIFKANIKEIGTEASISTRTYPVTLLIEPPEGTLLFAGMAGEAKLIGQEMGSKLTGFGVIIPPSALLADETLKQSFIFIYDPETKTVQKKQVQLGQMTDQGVLVTEGLSGGEIVVAAGVHFLKDGQQVKLLE